MRLCDCSPHDQRRLQHAQQAHGLCHKGDPSSVMIFLATPGLFTICVGGGWDIWGLKGMGGGGGMANGGWGWGMANKFYGGGRGG